MLKVVIDYPKLEEEKLIIRQNINGDKFEVKPILKADEIIEARKVVRQVYLDEKIEKYIVDIVFATRYPEKYDLKELKDMIGFGGSPRASINLALAARSYAFIKRRGYVIPEDVRAVAHDVLRHRIGLTYEAEASNMTSDEIVIRGDVYLGAGAVGYADGGVGCELVLASCQQEVACQGYDYDKYE